jgi:DNA-binding MurR/RpiR family transcriptional regulator
MTRLPSLDALIDSAVSPNVARVSIQTNIQAHLDSYPPSVRRIADAVLSRPQIALELTISELAHSCDTSETSVVRFCRALGFSGYSPFKLQMAAELATETAQRGGDAPYGSDILASDSLGDMVAKISASELFGIQETASSLDLAALQAVIDYVLAAPQTLVFGIGASNASALDLAQKLQRVGRIALGNHDAHNALTSAALLRAGDVAIGFSHSGRTREAVEFLRVARRAGASTVAVTNVQDSLLSKHADVTLRTAVRETTFRSGAMASRIAQLTVVDYIFVGVARANYDTSIQALRLTRESLRGLRDDR